jgi:hypothetical protein
MAAPIPATSAPLTQEDTEKRGIVVKLLQAQNKIVVDFAKQVVTICFAAVGVTLTLQDKWLTSATASGNAKLVLGIAVVLFLVGAILASAAMVAYPLDISLSDYEHVDAELSRVARLRLRITLAAIGVTTAATVLTAAVALWASVRSAPPVH